MHVDQRSSSIAGAGTGASAGQPPGQRPRQDPRRSLGKLGEEIALAHLHARGCELVERNVRTRHGEIDLIVTDGAALVFVEVKARRLGPQSALEGLSGRQRMRLRRLARAWLAQRRTRRPGQSELRFDAIGVLLDAQGRLVRLDHVEGAW